MVHFTPFASTPSTMPCPLCHPSPQPGQTSSPAWTLVKQLQDPSWSAHQSQEGLTQQLYFPSSKSRAFAASSLVLMSASSISGDAGADVVVVGSGAGGGGAGLPQASMPRTGTIESLKRMSAFIRQKTRKSPQTVACGLFHSLAAQGSEAGTNFLRQ